MSRRRGEQDSAEDIPRERNEPRPDFSKPPPPTRLPRSIQDTLDDDEKLWETLYEGKGGESTDSSVRYAAYASRIRTILLSAHRYVAYTSDIGESFRPVAHPWLVRGAYGVSWLYIGGDVAYEGYKAYLHNRTIRYPDAEPNKQNQMSALTSVTALAPGRVPPIEDYRAIMAQRAVFQSVASMGLPAFTIHSVVKYSGKAMKDVKNKTIRTWGPIGLGLSVVPFLPFIFDKPVEHAVEWAFHEGFKAVGGPSAVSNDAPISDKVPEKEL